MEKFKTIVKKNENIIILFILVLLLLGRCFAYSISANDELWNFQNIYKMLNGYKLYKDANVIITPLFFYISYFFVKILGGNLLAYRIYNLFLFTVFYFIIYKILKKLCKSTLVYILGFSLIISSTLKLVPDGASYNVLSLIFILLGIFLNLFWFESKQKHNIIQSIIMFLVFWTKQNIGIYYILGIFIFELLYKDFKSVLKQILLLGIYFVIGCTILILQGIFTDFINYAILGIIDFSNNNLDINIIDIIELSLYIIFLFITIPLICFKLKPHEIEKNRLIFLSSLSIMLLLISYPIFNSYHKILAELIVKITLIYIFELFRFFTIKNKKVLLITWIMTGIVYLCFIIESLYYFSLWIQYMKSNTFYTATNAFYGINISEENYNKNKIIEEYISSSEKNVIVLGKDAAMYMIPLKRSNGVMDLPFLGNLGKDGEDGLISKINELKNSEFLIINNPNDLFWQESKKIYNYIIDNLTKKGEIENFYIYTN